MKSNVNKYATRASIGVAALALAAGATVLATPSSAEARFGPFFPCICPHVYAPVQCDGGVVYSNQCFANCAGATGCVPGILF